MIGLDDHPSRYGTQVPPNAVIWHFLLTAT